jgi:predicted ester cyclase
MSAISIDRFEGDKLVEEWPEYDLLGVMRQIGAVPAPG